MKQSYWDRLEWVKAAAEMLQKHGVPPEEQEIAEHLLQTALDCAVNAMMSCLKTVQPFGAGLWCGKEDDYLKGTMPLAKDWDRLMENGPK